MNRWRGRLLVLVLVLIGAGTWWRLSDATSPLAAGSDEAQIGLTLYQGSAGIDLPEVQGRTIDGGSLSLADLRGNVLVLNVWGSWCGPCRAEAPDLAEISAETMDQGVRFIGIDVRDNPAAARAFEREFGITYPSFDDQDGQVLASFAGVVPVSAVPSTIVVDQSGVIRASIVGQIDTRTLRGLINDLRRAA
jgi:thiol-disulfide isomerase/thioredoxin